jgi:hypothetical protein
MYGSEVLMSVQMRAKFFATHFLHSKVSDIGLSYEWQFILWKKRLLHLQATSQMSDFDDVNFPVTVANLFLHLGLT